MDSTLTSSKQFESIGYWFFPLAASFLTLVGVFFGPVWSLAPGVWLLIVVPFLDLLVKKLHQSDRPKSGTVSHTAALVALVCCIYLTFFCGLLQLSSSTYAFSDIVMFGVGFGIVSGTVGMTASHELIHRKDKKLYFMGSSHLVFCLYGHYRIEHIYGHHVNVGKPCDPATARLNENLYSFLVRCVSMTVASAWSIEEERLRSKKLSLVSLHNRLIVDWLLQALLLITVTLIFGIDGIIMLLINSLVAIFLLESVEYLEHYGLQRKKTKESKEIHRTFEPFNHSHAWTIRNKVAAWSSFNLGLHSDHHLNGNKQYPMLNSGKTKREMPFNYTLMLVMALIPPVWFYVMNQKLKRKTI